MSDFARILEDYERRFRVLERRMENKELTEWVHQGALTDYSATSTITGWSSLTDRELFYQVTGNRVDVVFYLAGTSNAATAQFTLPIAARATVPAVYYSTCIVTDNGVTQTTPGRCRILAGASTVTFGKNTASTGGFTTSGAKAVIGQFWYWRA